MTLDVDATYVLVLTLFLVPLLILNGIVFKPFMKLFAERHERLEGALARAEKMIGEAEKKAAAFEDKVKIATSRGIEARNAIRATAAAEMSSKIEKERQVIQVKIEGALLEVQKTKTTALAEVNREAESIARTTAEKLLGRSVA